MTQSKWFLLLLLSLLFCSLCLEAKHLELKEWVEPAEDLGDTTLVSPAGQTKKFYWPNKPWQANKLSAADCPTLNTSSFFKLLKDKEGPNGVLGSVLSGEGEITLRVYAFAPDAALYDSIGSVKGPLLYGCKANKSLSIFQEVAFEQEEWNTSLDLGKLFAYYKVITAIATKLGASPGNLFVGAAAYLSSSITPNLLGTGLFSPMNIQLLKRARKSTEIIDAIYLFNSIRIFNIQGSEYAFKNKFKAEIPILIELELNNAKCSRISIPGFGIHNTVQFFTPEDYDAYQARAFADPYSYASTLINTGESTLSIKTLGNPTTNETVQVELCGTIGHLVKISLTSSSGITISEKIIRMESAKEIIQLPVGHSPGIYILTASDDFTKLNTKTIRVSVVK